MIHRLSAAALVVTAWLGMPTAASAETLLLRSPSLSADSLAFTYAGDVWLANRDGSAPRRLTSHPADARDPQFSGDGSLLAYSANHDGNYDVFVVPAAGGQPQRLTWHPGDDRVVGFSPGDDAVYFVSARERRHGRAGQLYRVALTGGLPEKVSEARVFAGAWSEDGQTFANVPVRPAYNGLAGGTAGWRGYRGGAAPTIQLIDFAAASVTEIAGDRTTEWDPQWIDGQLYFLSDRDEARFNVFRYDPATGAVTRITNETAFDVRAIGGRDGTLVYESGGRIHSLDLASGSVTPLSITLTADLPARQPQWQDVSGNVESLTISPTGQRVAVTARGEVFTVPIDAGAIRNISATPAARDYTAIWSDEGTRLAYVEDNGSGQSLVVEDQSGIGKPRRIDLGEDFNELRAWHGEHLLYTDNRLRLRAVDLASGQRWTVASADRRDIGDVTISPLGRWAAFTQTRANYNSSLWLYDLQQRQLHEVTGVYADVSLPAFSRDGKLLFFAASTNAGPTQVGLDMSTQQQPYRAGIYAAILEEDGDNPLGPRMGDEDPESAAKAEDDDTAEVPVVVSPKGIARRIVSLPVNEEYYASLATGEDGALYFVSLEQPGEAIPAPGSDAQADAVLGRFDVEKREMSELARGVIGIEMDRAGKTLLIANSDGSYATAEAGEEISPEALSLAGLRMLVDPAIEWPQIFNDVWRFEQAFFYDANMHGLDWAAVRTRFEALLPHVGRREDLNELMVEMIAELQVGHNRVGGGDVYDNSSASPGLLGADLAVANGRYRIERVFDGVRWNPFLPAPLAAPGVQARAGDYIMAINGQPLAGSDNIFRHLGGSQGRQVTLTLASNARGADARDVVVEPVESEDELRLWGWIENNRARVDEATDGRVAYVYLPDTAGRGFTSFNRMFFSQATRDALIMDDRSNNGGQAANYVIEILNRPHLAGWRDREGLPWTTPGAFIDGPKLMLIDQDAGSGGDFMPYAFRYTGLGPLMGTRTWGGLIGIRANPDLVDGGGVVVPFFRFYTPEGEYRIENEGVAPDIRVELDQMALDEGRDSQLEAAIDYMQEQIEDLPPRNRDHAPPPPTELGR